MRLLQAMKQTRKINRKAIHKVAFGSQLRAGFVAKQCHSIFITECSILCIERQYWINCGRDYVQRSWRPMKPPQFSRLQYIASTNVNNARWGGQQQIAAWEYLNAKWLFSDCDKNEKNSKTVQLIKSTTSHHTLFKTGLNNRFCPKYFV